MDISVAGMFGNSPRRDGGFVKATAQALEGLGFRALYAPEHVVFFPAYESKYPYSEDGSARWGPETGIYDPLFVAMLALDATSTLRFCTGIVILPQRPALLSAKEALTLDHFSGGRFEFGVGTGWSWEEYAALGVPFEQRGRRMNEYIEAMRVAWTDERATYHGDFVSFDDVVLNPKPVTPGGPPIIVGGSAPAAMRRAARMGEGWYGWWPDHYDIEAHTTELQAVLAAEGRSMDDADFSCRIGVPLTTETPDEVAAKLETLRRLGYDEAVVSGPLPTKGLEETLTGLAEVAGLR